MDELLARTERVDAEPHTVRRGIGLGTALLATGVLVALIVLGTAQGLLLVLWDFLSRSWQL